MTSRSCPTCPWRLLEPAHELGIEVDVCVTCAGLWFDAGELAAAMRAHDPTVATAARVADALGKERGRTRLSCPACRAPLHAHELSDQNPLLVDVCSRCGGVWLEHEELTVAQAGHQLAAARSVLDARPSWGHWLFQLLSSLPVEFNLTPRRRPLVTLSLLAVNALVFLVTLTGAADAFVDWLVLDPARFRHADWGVALLASQFIHADVVHLLGNLYFLWILGDNVEDVLGRPGFLAFYLAAGLAGGLAFTALTPAGSAPAVGASGAISGVMGAYLVLFRRSRLTFMLLVFQFKLSAPVYFGIWAAFNLAGWLAGSPGVAWEAHLGGLAFGLCVGLAGYRALLRRQPLLRLLNDVRLPATSSA